MHSHSQLFQAWGAYRLLMSISCWSCWSDQWLHYTVKGHARLKILVLRQASISLAIDTYHYNYRILGNLAAIKFGEMARNCSDKYLANLKFGDLHNQIESYDITCAAYAHSHFSPWITCTRLYYPCSCQIAEDGDIWGCIHGHLVFWGILNPMIAPW